MTHKWYIYENLNNPSDRLVLSDDQIVAGVYTIVGGPFDSKQEAEAVKQSLDGASG